MGWEKIIDILDWAKDKLPIPGRLERVKNEIVKLEKEKRGLLNAKADVKKARRLTWINARIELLNKRLQNATDSS